MRDIKSIERVALLHPAVRLEVANIITEVELKWPANIAVRIVQGLRTFEEQDALYQKGRTTAGPSVTNAKPGSSYHQYGLALDYALLYDNDGNGNYEELSWSLVKDADKNGRKDWIEVSDAFVAKGWEWGGSWRTFIDNPHVQKTFHLHWKEMLKRYNNEEFIPDTKYIKL